MDEIKLQICELSLIEIFRNFKHRPVIDREDIVDKFDEIRKEEDFWCCKMGSLAKK